ncbi:glutamine-serine-proline rich [Grosmannia clavigera kw1407]|uniref:Glutamine-serine-proline rich n=1 Tax=Grosmannia clavigera (strain kw1407 / UAMH 11150) TaxID=655863 RepID=F0X7A5_GROCL|nr:glutamine-serine-proline rich [Grosmannia clavigera kw1407]EFX06518.1 glutamine-serine-proline rich [Grosmannia clavigera kw1407]
MEDNRYGYDRPGGEANSYYSDGQQGREGYGSNQYGNDRNEREEHEGGGDRGIMGALVGGAAGAYGGHELGGRMAGHSKTGTVLGAVMGAFAGSKAEGAIDDWRDDRKENEMREDMREDDERRREEAERRREEDERRREDYNHENQGYNRPTDYGSNSRSIGGGGFAGNFSSSSQGARLEPYGDYNLTVECRTPEGSFRVSTISLNRYIGNSNGSFCWSAGGGGGETTMVVQQGEYLREIAARFNCSYEDIARINNIDNPDMIYPGQVLRLPGGGGGGGNFGASAQNVRLVDDGRRLEGELRRSDGGWDVSSIILDERIANDNGNLRFI